jgi:hypothetical protein
MATPKYVSVSAYFGKSIAHTEDSSSLLLGIIREWLGCHELSKCKRTKEKQKKWPCEICALVKVKPQLYSAAITSIIDGEAFMSERGVP